MFILKLISYLFIGLLLSSCSIEPATLDRSIKFTADQIALPQVRELEDKELQYLTEMSDLIITGKVIEEKPIVDPEKMQEELESSRAKNLPNIQKYVKGYVYNIEVSEVIYRKNIINDSKSISIYAYGNPFSLHTNFVRFIKGREYLIFLSLAKEKDIVKGLKVLNPKGRLSTDQIDYRHVFIVTSESRGLRQIKDKTDLVKEVKKMVEEIKGGKSLSSK